MNKLISELRRREVFRTAGLYVGVCWILIEVGSVILPAFGAPDWLFRGAIIAAVAGFPVMLVLAWFFDVNKAGISLQGDATDTVVEPLRARKTDYAIIGVLVIALIVSLSLNISKEAPVAGDPEPVSVLIASFDNATGDPLFDGVLEAALTVGIEVAPHVTAFDRKRALELGRESKPVGASLDRELARDVAQRAGIGLILAGSVQPAGDGYRISVEVIDAADGEPAFTIDEKADSRDAVLAAIGSLSAKARKRLGDPTLADAPGAQAQAFAAASLEAAHAYATARQFEAEGDLDEAANYYEQAIAADPKLGRAVARLALVEFALGRDESAAAHWASAQSLMGTMTERERLRTLGRYYTSVAFDGDTAVKIYAEFVDSFPAAVTARERYAAAAFRQLDLATAIGETRSILEIFPADHRQRTKLAVYAMYDGDWETASAAAGQVIAADPQYGIAYLPVAMAALAEGKADAARDAYARMAQAGKSEHGASAAELGLADIDLYLGQIDAAQSRLAAGITVDIDSGNARMAALKSIALAELHADQERFPAARAAAAEALQLDDSVAVSVSAAMIDLRAGLVGSAAATAELLSAQADAHSRAYGQMLKGMILENEGAQTEAILAMRDAIATADLWLIRLQIGKAYLRAGNYLEALDELTSLKVRRGEATAVFLDDMPTYRLLAELPYWTGRVQEALKLAPAARASYAAFVALRPQGGALAEDAAQRASVLE